MDPDAINDLCFSPEFVARVEVRAGRAAEWESVFRGPGEAAPRDPYEVFLDPAVFAGADAAPAAPEPPEVARARNIYLAASSPDLKPGAPAEQLIGAALAAEAGLPDKALRLRLLAFLRLSASGTVREAPVAAGIMAPLLNFPERPDLCGLQARALASAAATLLGSGSGGARAADRFLGRLLALKGLGAARDLSAPFVALSLRLGRPEPPPWGPRPGFGAFGGALKAALGLVGQLPGESLADLPVVAVLKDPALCGVSLVEIMKIRERLGVPPRSGRFRALRLALGVLEASVHLRDGGRAGGAAALEVFRELEGDGALECLSAEGPGAPDAARLKTLAARLGRAFASASEADLAGLLALMGRVRRKGARPGFWAGLPAALAGPFAEGRPGALEEVFDGLARGPLFGGDAEAALHILVSSVLARDCRRSPSLNYSWAAATADLGLTEAVGQEGPGVPGRSATLRLARALARVAADPSATGEGGAAPDPGAPFRELAGVWEACAGPDTPARLRGLFFVSWAAAAVASACGRELWAALPAAAALCPPQALEVAAFKDGFLAPALFLAALKTQEAGLNGAVAPLLQVALALPRTPELAGAAAALLRLEIFRTVADGEPVGAEARGLFRELISSGMDPGFGEDLLDAMLVRLGVSGETEAMGRLFAESIENAAALADGAVRAPALAAGLAAGDAVAGQASAEPPAAALEGRGTGAAGAGGPEDDVAAAGAPFPGRIASGSEGSAAAAVPGDVAAGEAAVAGSGSLPGSGGEGAAFGEGLPDGSPFSAALGPGPLSAAIVAYFLAEAGDFQRAGLLLTWALLAPGHHPAKRAAAELVIAGLAAAGLYGDASSVCDSFASFAESEGETDAADRARVLLGEAMRGAPGN
jgi:hypothetical protein